MHDGKHIRYTAWTFGHQPTYTEAATQAVLIEAEETKRGYRVDRVSIYPNTGTDPGYVYCLESSTTEVPDNA